ncbi:MAG: hypothetical protein K9G67_04385 [Bacteroidales bacterium]|nr:hypothetical protein [Bacteroidales bacterium]MCF8345393.1 hypothetical protein [Bacteroidales bacterium]MCF8349834.1 hypothetical protein [Bacteroidales bacterium]MCF8375570.1 hypothetical protein [Bacteroidales bacterium]MCF8402207.1 hypothetical protein [Bacteroidales bacterium]
MRKTIFLFVCFLLLGSQLNAQQFLLLSKPGKLKNYKYFIGDHLHLEIQDSLRMAGVITGFQDSLIELNASLLLHPSDIQIIYRERRMLMFLNKAGLLAGLGYFGLTGFNRLMNKDAPVYTESSLWISGALIGGSFLLRPFLYKKIRLKQEGWQLEILGFHD